MHRSFMTWLGLIFDITFVLGFIILIFIMFYRDVDYIYIICTALIMLLPIWGIYKCLKTDKN
ncbi:hypothetical protein HpBTM60_32660 [Helicobacter pylori]